MGNADSHVWVKIDISGCPSSALIQGKNNLVWPPFLPFTELLKQCHRYLRPLFFVPPCYPASDYASGTWRKRGRVGGEEEVSHKRQAVVAASNNKARRRRGFGGTLWRDPSQYSIFCSHLKRWTKDYIEKVEEMNQGLQRKRKTERAYFPLETKNKSYRKLKSTI